MFGGTLFTLESLAEEVDMRPIRFVFTSLAVIVLMANQSQSAQAGPPQFDYVELNFIFPIEGCDFPVQGELTGTLKVSVHSDNNGDFKMLIERVVRDSQSTYTNLETGFSISSSHGAGIDKILIEEDGSITFVAMGVFDILPMSGQGLIVQDVGRIVFNTTTGELLFSAGQFTVHGPGGTVEALCSALE
jgi:hypothetical protein